MVLWKYFKLNDELPEPRGSLVNDIPSRMCYRASQSSGLTRQPPFTTCVKPSVTTKRIVISVYLNSVCYLILYTRLFTKLNLFEILLSVTFLTTKFSRSTVSHQYQPHLVNRHRKTFQYSSEDICLVIFLIQSDVIYFF